MKASADNVQTRSCLVNPDALAQPADDVVPARAALLLSGVTQPYRLLEGRGQPDVDAEEALRAAEQAPQLDGRHTHDRERQPVDGDCPAQYRRIGAELRKPHAVADHRDGAGLDRIERTPMDRPQPHRIEVVGLHYLGGHAPGLSADAYADRHEGRRAEVLEHVGRGLANIEIVRIGVHARPTAREVARGHYGQPMRVRAGQRTQEQSVEQRENDGVRTDADGQHRDGHDGEHRARAQAAEPELEVAPQVVDGAEAVHVAALFLDHLQASHAGQRHAARFLGSHAAPDVLGRVQLHVRLKLCIELAFEGPAADKIQQANGEDAQAAHDDSSRDGVRVRWRGMNIGRSRVSRVRSVRDMGMMLLLSSTSRECKGPVVGNEHRQVEGATHEVGAEHGDDAPVGINVLRPERFQTSDGIRGLGHRTAPRRRPR